MDTETLIHEWSASLENGTAAVFIGAGLARRAGYPDWRNLLEEVALELGLEIEQENDLAGVAQYSVNRAAGKRHRLWRLVTESFPPRPVAPEPYRILARLPLRHIWTTNYDSLVEVAWRAERKILDVKSRNYDVGIDNPWAHATLYKMHGSVDHPREVVVAKDDYELYRRVRPAFLQLLAAHLVSRQVLFLGFSFTDPNLMLLFASIREALQRESPGHFAIVARPKPVPHPTRQDKVNAIRHALWMEDLKRYGIQCVEIDHFNEIDDILKQVEWRLCRANVLVLGSFPDPRSKDERSPQLSQSRHFVEGVAREIGRLAMKRKRRLISGYGPVVGTALVGGALDVLLTGPTPVLDQSLLLRSFPAKPPPGIKTAEYREMYRDSMILQAGACIFIGGFERDGANGLQPATETLAEFDSARRFRRLPIPIGATGGAAEEIWKAVDHEYDRFLPAKVRPDFNRLNRPGQTPKQLARAVEGILKACIK
ncbi:MAG: SIR2 family protein [Verrucomicrobia bacterium]|nr:SIR2 family protein [Verrucomicrobiota bacterium]